MTERSRTPGGTSGRLRPVDDERYERGTRRTMAEPLTASWEPDPADPGDVVEPEFDPEPPKPRWRAVLDTYGWRVYAVPVLVVLTVLVVLDVAGRGPGGGQENADGPVVTENPAAPADLNIPTAELPQVGGYTKAGKGTWHIVPGSSPKVGSGQLYKYTVEVEDGIDPADYGGDQSFARLIDETLDNPRSWTFDGKIAVQRVGPEDPDPDFRISLTTPATDHRPDLCGYSIKYESSCYRSSEGRVVINLSRWVNGAKAFSGDMLTYRQYAINHEVGHAFGNGHVGCERNGALAPVMMQQSFGVSNNYVAKLNKVDPLNAQAVPADGKVCKPNAWPNPSGEHE
jgi:hypothetical protein